MQDQDKTDTTQHDNAHQHKTLASIKTQLGDWRVLFSSSVVLGMNILFALVVLCSGNANL